MSQSGNNENEDSYLSPMAFIKAVWGDRIDIAVRAYDDGSMPVHSKKKFQADYEDTPPEFRYSPIFEEAYRIELDRLRQHSEKKRVGFREYRFETPKDRQQQNYAWSGYNQGNNRFHVAQEIIRLVTSSGEPIHPTPKNDAPFLSMHLKPPMSIFWIQGHGDGDHIANMKPKALATLLEKSGVKPDILLFEVCHVATVATLSALEGKAGLALCSEFGIMNFPVHLFSEPLRDSLNAADFRDTMAKSLLPPGYVAVDLAKVHKLREMVLQILPPLVRHFKIEDFHNAAQQSFLTQEAELTDLGVVLSLLEERHPSNEVSEVVASANETLGSVILHKSDWGVDERGVAADWGKACGVAIHLKELFTFWQMVKFMQRAQD